MKTKILVFLFCFPISAKAQINIIQQQEEKKEIHVEYYDSLESLNKNNAHLHLGQTLFLKGTPYTKENGFSFYFYTRPTIYKTLDEFMKYYRLNKTYLPLVVNGDTIENTTDYNKVIGKYYKVIDIIKDEKELNLKLSENDSTQFYLDLRTSDQYDNFTTLGFYEKVKQIFLGKEFYSIGTQKELISGKELEIPYKTLFKCVDIGLCVGSSDNVFAILENPKYGKIKSEIYNAKNTELRSLHYKLYFNDIIKKFGSFYGDKVLKGQITLGMSSEMVKEVYGLPNEITSLELSNKKGYLWIYDYKRLYFENGKLKSIQNF